MGFSVSSCYLTERGADLFTVVCLPEAAGRYPVVLSRSPYEDSLNQLSDEEAAESILESCASWLERGYAVIRQHCRGTGKSSGDCIPYINEREDGLALQAWVRKQPFYNGEIFLCGGSYLSSVHYVTAPFAEDIKGAVLNVQDCERYNIKYRNGFFKAGLHGKWYMGMYKKKSIKDKSFHVDAFNMLPLTDLPKAALGEDAEDLLEAFRHPDRNDSFWQTRFGGGEAHDAVKHARIPILLTTHFYDIYTGGVFDMWNSMDAETRAMSALAVSPYDHSGTPKNQPVEFENGMFKEAFGSYDIDWFDFVRGKRPAPFEQGKVTYYRLFENQWRTEMFENAPKALKVPLGTEEITYTYNPYAPASFVGGLSANFGGTAWQDAPNSRYDIKSFISLPFEADTFVKGRMEAKLRVKSDCEDTCFYMRISLVKEEGAYGLRDDIHALSEFAPDYVPGEEVEMRFRFDEHAFLVKKGE